MDIISHGKFHHNIYRLKCGKCGCIFDYSEYDRHGYAGIHRLDKQYVTCPECGKWLKHKFRIRRENYENSKSI